MGDPGGEGERKHFAVLEGEPAEGLGDDLAVRRGERQLRRPRGRIGPAGDPVQRHLLG